MDMSELYKKFYTIGREYITMQGISLEDEHGNEITGIINKIGKENKIVFKIEKKNSESNKVEKMSIFDIKTEDDEIKGTESALASVLTLTAEAKIKLRLGHICDAISASITSANINDSESVRPYVDGRSCAIRITVANHEPFDIWVVVGCIPCINILVMTKDFTNIGIVNAEDIVSVLNNYFDGINFMLDIDTNEN